MEGKYLDNCLSIEANDDAYKEKTRIAEVATATLCRLNGIMKQMKDRRDERAKLTSNMWRLKLALCVAGKETEDTLHADPLIERQRGEIKRLELANRTLKKEIADVKASLPEVGGYVARDTTWKHDDKLAQVKQEYLAEREHLNNEIQYLKSQLNETKEGHEHSSEVEHLKCKLKHFMMVDHTMEIIFTDIVNKVAETIANLSEELVNVNECLHRSRLKNTSLYIEIDKLKAMQRSRCGNLVDYQKRIAELENLTKRLKMELNKLKVNYSNSSWGKSANYRDSLRNAELLTNDLKNKLKNDHQALIAAGDPDCSNYMQRITELRASLKQLHGELAKFIDDPDSSCSKKTMERDLQQFSLLGTTLTEINVEIDELRNDHVRRYGKIGGNDGVECLNKIEELIRMVEKTRETMSGLSDNRGAEGNSNEWRDIERLEGLVGNVCDGMEQLEVIVTAGDRWNMSRSVEQLEGVIVRLKSESKEKDEHVNVLCQELFDMKSLVEQRNKELKGEQGKVASLLDEYKALKGRTKRMEEERRTEEIQREQEGSRKELEQLQQVKREASMVKKRLQNLEVDKEGLLKEMGRIREVLQRRDEEAKVAEKEATEKTMDLMKNVSRENEKLRNKINELERAKRKERETVVGVEKKNVDAEKRSRETSRHTGVELERLRGNLAVSKEELDRANREIVDLKAKLEHFSSDKTRLEASIFHLESKKEILVYQLGAEKTTAEERVKELVKLESNYNELGVERTNLKNKKEQLSVELANLKIEKKSMEESVERVRVKCSTLEDEIDRYKSECDNLREEMRNLKTNGENLTAKLEETRLELKGAGDKISQLEFENSKLDNDLNGLTLKNAGFEGHVQVLLSEKNELATCINEVQQENVLLKDQLNEVKTANEYSAVELDKLRTACDKARSENTVLQVALDETRRRNETLRETGEELKLKLAEIHSEYRILKNQLKILQLMNATLRKEKDMLEHEYANSLRLNLSRMEKEEGSVVYSERGKQIAKPLTGKAASETKRDNLTKSSKHGKQKTEARKDVKKLTVENESLKFEILHLRSQNFEVKVELTRLKEELQRQQIDLSNGRESDVAIKSNKPEIVDLYYKEISSYSSRDNNVSTVACIDQSSVCPYDVSSMEEEAGTDIERLLEMINKLKVENVALKIEVNSLRCNLVVNFVEDEKRRNEVRDTTEEIGALKVELTKVREEKESLRVRLDTAGTKLNQLESEKAALKDELYTLRKINSDFKHKVNELRCDYQKLKERSGGFENCIVRAIKKIKKHTTSTEDRNSPASELTCLLKRYISDENVMCSIEQGITMEGT